MRRQTKRISPDDQITTRERVRLARAAKKRRNTGSIALVLVTAIIIVLGAVVGVGWFLFAASGADVASGQDIAVEIEPGSGTTAIANQLARSGVVANANMFKIIARIKQADGSFKAGSYTLTAGLSYDAAIAALQEGPKATFVTLTIPEGKTIAQVASIVEEETGIKAKSFAKVAKGSAPDYVGKYPYLADAHKGSLEGFLFPDTYNVDQDATARDVVEMMLARFDEVYSDITIPKARLKEHSVHELITIASLVEREARIAKERPLVASVIENRLERGMRLQLCSSVQFLLPGEEERTKIRLTNADISIKSPYNTYINQGLPPGPIANPGRAALEAAAKPAKTDYIYFVLTGKDGSQTFASTSAEFTAAKAKSKAVLGE